MKKKIKSQKPDFSQIALRVVEQATGAPLVPPKAKQGIKRTKRNMRGRRS